MVWIQDWLPQFLQFYRQAVRSVLLTVHTTQNLVSGPVYPWLSRLCLPGKKTSCWDLHARIAQPPAVLLQEELLVLDCRAGTGWEGNAPQIPGTAAVFVKARSNALSQQEGNSPRVGKGTA